MLAAHDGFLSLSFAGVLEHFASVLPSDGTSHRMNDGKVDPQGRFWAGSMAFDETVGAGALHCLKAGFRGWCCPTPRSRVVWRGQPMARPCPRSTLRSNGSIDTR